MAVVSDPRQGTDCRVDDTQDLDQRDHEDGSVVPAERSPLEVPLKMMGTG